MRDTRELGLDFHLGRIGERIPASEVLRHPPERLPRGGIQGLAADEAADELVDSLKPVCRADAAIDDAQTIPENPDIDSGTGKEVRLHESDVEQKKNKSQ